MSKFNSIQDPENGKLYGIDTRRGRDILSRYLGKMVGDLPIPDQSRWNKYGERPIEKYDFIADKQAMTDYQLICCKDDWIEDKHDQQWFPRDIGNIDKPRTIRKYADKIEEFYMNGWGDKFGERRLETTNKYRKGIFKEVAKKLIKNYQIGEQSSKGGDAIAVTLRQINQKHTCHILLISSIEISQQKNYFNIVDILSKQRLTYQTIYQFETIITDNYGHQYILLFSVIDRLVPLIKEDIRQNFKATQMISILRYMSDNFIYHGDCNNLGNWMKCGKWIKIIDFNYSIIINPKKPDPDIISNDWLFEHLEKIVTKLHYPDNLDLYQKIEKFVNGILTQCLDLKVLKDTIFISSLAEMLGYNQNDYPNSLGYYNSLFLEALQTMRSKYFNTNLGILVAQIVKNITSIPSSNKIKKD